MTKIDVISGFLGAGKTTFIKKLLEEAVAKCSVYARYRGHLWGLNTLSCI